MMNEEYIKITQEWHRKGFESRQAEIDELKHELETLQGMHNAVSRIAGELVDDVVDLQNRIDEALIKLNDARNNGVDKSHYEAIKILKGATP